MTLTLTVIVPAHNEEEGLPDTLESLLRQTEPPEAIIVVDDGSTDRTKEVASSYDGVTVLSPPWNLGSKARAQNYALDHCDTDLVLPVDADTVLADDYIEKIKRPFQDDRPTGGKHSITRGDRVAIAAGCVLTRHTKTVWERGRQIEYLFGFHWYRPVQQLANSPTVCSGCCSTFRLSYLKEFGGFPERTIVEDIDYTWSQQIAGRRAVYVHDAVAYAAEPTSLKYMSKQLWRWKSGYFQNVRQHYWNLLRRKQMLAVWVSLQMFEIALAPLILGMPLLWWYLGATWVQALQWWAFSEAVIMGPPLAYGCWKRKINPLNVLRWYPSWYVLKALNFFYDCKASFVELILVPLGRAEGLVVYEKGRA